jgi:Zn ribbon nucleic-acid-binding protein
MKNIRQQFKGESLTRTKVVNSILRMWDKTTEDERFDWYGEANEFCKQFDNSLQVLNKTKGEVIHSIACGVVAALSPVKTWEQNKIQAIKMMETGDCGHMKQFKDKAKRIIQSDGSDEQILSVLNGRKISAFYLNIKYPEIANNLTIDRHALSIALGRWVTDEDYRGMTAKQYNFFVECFILSAVKRNVSPLLMQSATWVRFRKIKKDYR